MTHDDGWTREQRAVIQEAAAMARAHSTDPTPDDVLMRLTPDYHGCPKQTRLYHRLATGLRRELEGWRPATEPNGRACEHCGTPLTGRQQRYCSLKCVGDANAAAARDSIELEPKTCEHCGDPFEAPKNYGAVQWATRRYCSPDCALDARRVA